MKERKKERKKAYLKNIPKKERSKKEGNKRS